MADAAPAAPKKTPARKTPAKKTSGTRVPSKAAADKAAATVEVVAEPSLKLDRSESARARNAAPKKTASTAARTAAAKTPTRDTTARATATKASSARSAAAKTAAAKTAAARTAAAKATAAKGSTSSTSAAKTAAAKTAAAKAAGEKSASAKSAARTSAAKAAAAKTSAAKTAAAKASAAKAAAAAAAAAEAEDAETAPVEADAAQTPGSQSGGLDVPETDTTYEAAAVKTEVSADTPAPPPPLTPATQTEISADSLTDARGDEEASASGELSSSDETAADAPVAPLAEPLADVVSVEDSTAGVASVAEPAEDPAIDENTTSEPVDAVPDSDATEEAVSGVEAASGAEAIRIRGLVKNFGDHTAVNGIDLTVPAGSFYGIVGPNGAGKTTTLSIVAGLLRADAGDIMICGIDQSAKPLAAKRMMGVLPDRLRTFDRLTGRQLLYYYGLLRGLASAVIEKRVADLARAFDLGEALNRVVSDYSAGMTKKIMLAGAMIHSPRVLVLDEPFEAVDPVSSAVILDILRAYVAHGGTVVLSSHGMDLVERVCSRVAIIVGGEVLAEGTIDEVRAGQTLEARFVELSGGIGEVEGLEWLHTFSD